MKGLFMKKEKRNRIISALMVLVMSALLMTGCGGKRAASGYQHRICSRK